jgi:hypothetical protein
MKRRVTYFDWAILFQWMMATTLGWLLANILFAGLAVAAGGIAVGVFQWLVLQRRLNHAARWVLATAAGWSLGWGIGFFTIPAELPILSSLITGALTGGAQWLLLRSEVRWSGWWIAISAMGWTAGLSILPGMLLTGTVAGLVTGFALAQLLRNPISSTAG